MRGMDVNGLDIDSHDLSSAPAGDGVDVVPLVDAEPNRQSQAASYRGPRRPRACATAGRARPPGQPRWPDTARHRRRPCRDSGPLAQTLRHLVLATDAWLGRDPARRAAVPRDRADLHRRRADRLDMSIFREDVPGRTRCAVRATTADGHDFLGDVARGACRAARRPWGGTGGTRVGDCVRVILEEEWAHLRRPQGPRAAAGGLRRTSRAGRPDARDQSGAEQRRSRGAPQHHQVTLSRCPSWVRARAARRGCRSTRTAMRAPCRRRGRRAAVPRCRLRRDTGSW